MTAYLKKLLGDGLAGLDKSHGTDRLYDLLAALVAQTNDLTDQFNQMRSDQIAASGKTNNVVVNGLIVTTPSTPSSQITGAGNTTWNVNVGAGRARVNDVEADIVAAADTAIHSGSKLLDDGQSVYAAMVITESGGSLSITPVKGTVATTGSEVEPTDAEITTAVGSANWAKIALCHLSRTGDTTLAQTENDTQRTLLVVASNTSATAVTKGVAIEA